jgi:predicted transcriptional regulator
MGAAWDQEPEAVVAARRQHRQPAGKAALTGMLQPAGANARERSSRDPVAVRAFIERFTTQLAQAGFPRTPARIFVALLTSDSSTLTAAELGDLLQISAASVSSGVRYLLHVGLATAEGEPGSRRLHYRMSQEVWQDIVHMRDRQFRAWATELRQGVEALGPGSPAGTRLAETVRYFEFISGETTGLLARGQAAFAGAGSETGQAS